MPARKGPVLVVDDDPDMRDAIRDALTDEGYEIAEAANGLEALDYLRAHPPPALILLDWNMAPMNGSQFLAEATKDPVLAKIPVVLLTADVKAPEKANGNGIVGYLMKPVDLGPLLDVLGRYCG